MLRKHRPLFSIGHFLLVLLLLCCPSPLSAGDPHSAYSSFDTDKILWFIHASDTHLGTSGSNDSTNLQWLVGPARSVINPSFIVVTGDLTDSTNGNILGYPNGPYQEEWDQYKNILSAHGVDASFYFDIPGNHDAYNDQYFSYYLANSVQGRATGKTQASWSRVGPWGKHHFIGINSADNTGDAFSIFWPFGDRAGLDSSELSSISAEMAANPDANLTLVFGHHPLVPTGDSDETYLLYGKDEFVGLMNSHGASLYGYGHTHDSSEKFFTQNMSDGVFYFNVTDLGKGSPNQYMITAIDCNGISSVSQTVGTWPVVLITAPTDRRLGGMVNPYAYAVSTATPNPVRALVFDPTAVTQVQFRVSGGSWQSMESVPGNPRLWQGEWDASALAEGEYTLEVQATTGSGVRTDTVATYAHYQAPVNGACGSSSGGVFAEPPYSNLCSIGIPSARGAWTWSCIGHYGGTTADCSALYGYLLTVSLAGSGSGSVHSTSDVSGVPSDISCTGGSCSAGYPNESIVNLSASPDSTSIFTGWSGACTSTPCTVAMDAAKSVTAAFSAAPMARNATTGLDYATLAAAITAASSGNEIRTLGSRLDEAVLLDKSIVLRGGWNATYTGKSGLPTLLHGDVTIQIGDSSAETIDVEGTLSIQNGSLLVEGVVLR